MKRNHRKKLAQPAIVLLVLLLLGVAVGLLTNRRDSNPGGSSGEALPRLVITTPRETFSPYMSSMFGFALVLQQVPPAAVQFAYTCDRGSFCTYADDQITPVGNEVTTAETVYWAPYAPDWGNLGGVGLDDGFRGNDTQITVQVLAEDGRVMAYGTAVVQNKPAGPNGENPDFFTFVSDPADA